MKKIIVKCIGGLGNQMFQYAFYKYIQQEYDNVFLDVSYFDNYLLHNGYELYRVFSINANLANKDEVKQIEQLSLNASCFKKIWWKVTNANPIIKQTNFGFAPKYLELNISKYLDGYWQSEKYFEKYANLVRKDFIFPILDKRNENLSVQILESSSVSIHIRRGDYVNHPLHGGICDTSYYLKAISLISSKVSNPRFFIFSDDIGWCKENLSLDGATYIDWNCGNDSYKDMQLMSMCKHNIIANSSFSWWGAWLNNNPEKVVIAPAKWFNNSRMNVKDIIPDKWYKI